MPVSAYILWPFQPRRLADGFPIVAWAHGVSGLEPDCAPSHIRNLWQHSIAPFPLALQGYVVLTPDFAGLGVSRKRNNETIDYEIFDSPSGANDLFYAVQAAQQAFLALSSDFVVMVHSFGAGAAWSSAQRQSQQPVDGYLGAVAVSPLTNAIAEPGPTASERGLGLAHDAAILMPDFSIADVLTPGSQQVLDLLNQSGGCQAMMGILLGAAGSLAKDEWQQNPHIQKYQAEVFNGGKQISSPLLVTHGEADTTISFNVTVDAIANTIGKFAESQLQFLKLPGVSHVPALQASQYLWLDWIEDRFAKKPVPKGLQTSTIEPFRPLNARQPDLYWFIDLVTKLYEAPP